MPTSTHENDSATSSRTDKAVVCDALVLPPVLDVEGLAKQWEGEAFALRSNATRTGNLPTASRANAKAEQLEQCAIELRLLMEHDKPRWEAIMAALRHDGQLVTALRREVETLERYKTRMEWLHDCSNGCTDAEGFEWGIYRVKWENGQAVQVWQTNSDFSDLDAEMAREASLQNT